MNKKLLAIALVATAAFTSCKKDPTTSPSPTGGAASTPSPTFTSGDGAIIALITRSSTSTPIGPVDISLGTGVAVFGNLSTQAYTDAGIVSLNGKTLGKQDNGSYVFIPSATDITGIEDLDSKIEWAVGTPSFTHNAAPVTGLGMPRMGSMAGTYTSIDTKSDFTLAISGTLTNADSIYYQVASPNGKYALKVVKGTVKTVTFTAAEMKDFGTGIGGNVVIAAYNHQLKTLGGKSIHVINELALSRVVEFK